MAQLRLLSIYKKNSTNEPFGISGQQIARNQKDVEAAFLDAKLVDGTIVRIEPAVEVGAVVKVIDEAANELDAPDGDHELEDGTIIRTEGAVVVEVMAPEVEEEEPEAEAEEVEEEMSTEDVDVKMSAIAADVLAAHNFASVVFKVLAQVFV